ncbi:hypothetical protein CAEBREN_14835 [Caenorhabditis brenneri]|uniref:Uncharacterized protein n=1 Tax=Caenorhabditis brenneri TaxID=135651 RepID=G0N1B1_CAEBE|nr:hypothetical protein CAEBREN_14835 [Caenorhabditis brenneri]
MDTIKQRVSNAYNERYTELMSGIMAFFIIVWGVLWVAAVNSVYINPTAPRDLDYLTVICLLGWFASTMLSFFAIEYWLRTPQVRRPYDEDRDRYGNGLPLYERGPLVAAPPAAQN